MEGLDRINDRIDILYDRIVEISSAIEEIRNGKSETVEMNSKDKELIISELTKFENDVSENLKSTLIDQQTSYVGTTTSLLTETKAVEKKLIDSVSSLSDECIKIQKSIPDITGTIRSSVDNGFMEAGKKQNDAISKAFKSEITPLHNSLSKTIDSFGNTLLEVRDNMAGFCSGLALFVFLAVSGVLCVAAFRYGEYWKGLSIQKNSENVFELFYKEKYEKEIAVPMKNAIQEAEDYLDSKKKEADEYYQNKLKETDEFYAERINQITEQTAEDLKNLIENNKEKLLNLDSNQNKNKGGLIWKSKN